MTNSSSGAEPVGILAGRGSYPHLLASRILKTGQPVVVAGIRGQFTGGLPVGCGPLATFPLGAIGRTAHFFRSAGATRIYFAGGVSRRGILLSVRPDRHAWRLLFKAFFCGDDELLRAAAHTMRSLGVEVDDPTTLLDDLFAPEGRISGPEPDRATRDDIAVAWEAAKRLGARDAGQAALGYNGNVVGLEGKGGTDALLTNAPGPGAVMAKAVKPYQDRRFDLPAIGPSTIRIASAVGLRAIAVEAGGVLLLERNRVMELCRNGDISLIGISP